jgi:hypothetical protein
MAVALPRRSATVPWIAWGLVSVWCLSALILGLARWVNAGTHVIDPGDTLGLHVRLAVGFGLIVVWFMSFNLAFAGLVMGIIATVRGGSGRLWRPTVLATLVIGGAVVQIWSLSFGSAGDGQDNNFVQDGRLGALVMCVSALAVTAGAAVLLRRRSPSAQSQLK